MACVRSLPSSDDRDRARAMRHARYVGPAGKGGSESLYGSAWFGSVWGGILGGILVGLRARDFPTERVLSRTPSN